MLRQSDAQTSTSLELMTPDQVAAHSTVRRAWDLTQSSDIDLYSLYQSTTWWDHAVATQNGRQLRLGVLKSRNEITAVIPLESRNFDLPLPFGRRRAVGIPFRVLSAVTIDPLLRLFPADALQILNALAIACPRQAGLYVKSVDIAAPLWTSIMADPQLADSFVYVADKARPLYSIALPATFDEYLSKFSGKTRNTLRRKVKILMKEAGALSLTRASDVESIPAFVRDVREIGKRSWKQTGTGWSHITDRNASGELEEIARRGFLRSYVLRVGTVPCAFVNGYQYKGVYHYADLAYDERFAKLSPGLVLLFLLIEDLCDHDPPRQLNFGTGYADYKRQFANEIRHDASILVLRRTIANRLRVQLHSGFLSLKGLVKKCLQRDIPQVHELSEHRSATQPADLAEEPTHSAPVDS